MSDPLTALSPRWQAALALAFGALTSLFVVLLGSEPMPAVDLLVLAASLGALATAGLWLWLVAARLSRGWGFAFALTLWIPYVNFVVASLFARRYWSQGARAPALLALLGMIGQAVATVWAFAATVTVPV
ncbi:MAG: hypothetical protein ACHQ6T_03815 [Myxococcota bacterium]